MKEDSVLKSIIIGVVIAFIGGVLVLYFQANFMRNTDTGSISVQKENDERSTIQRPVKKLPKEVFLSDLKPVTKKGDYKLNPGENGKPLYIGGYRYLKGVSFKEFNYGAECYIEFNLQGKYKRLKGFFGIDDESSTNDPTFADFFVYLDDNLGFDSLDVKPGQAMPLDLDVTNVNYIKLRIIAKGGWELDAHRIRIDWANLVLE